MFLRGIEFGLGLWLGAFIFIGLIVLFSEGLSYIRCRFFKRKNAHPGLRRLSAEDLLSLDVAAFRRRYGDGWEQEKPVYRASIRTVIAWDDRVGRSKKQHHWG